MTWIAEIQIIWIYVGGKRVPGQVAIGAPEFVRDGDDEAICPVTLGGLDGPERITRIHGVGKFHALLQGLHFIEARLRDSVARGIRVEFPDADDDPESATECLLAMFRPLAGSRT